MSDDKVLNIEVVAIIPGGPVKLGPLPVAVDNLCLNELCIETVTDAFKRVLASARTHDTATSLLVVVMPVTRPERADPEEVKAVMSEAEFWDMDD